MTSAPSSPPFLWSALASTQHRLPFIDARGISHAHSRDRGRAACADFLHSSGGHIEAYARNIDAHAPHFRTIAMDMLGHGFTDKRDRDYEIHDYCEDLADVMHCIGI